MEPLSSEVWVSWGGYGFTPNKLHLAAGRSSLSPVPLAPACLQSGAELDDMGVNICLFVRGGQWGLPGRNDFPVCACCEQACLTERDSVTLLIQMA